MPVTEKPYYKDTPLTLFGEKTPRAIIYKHESHKLHQAFSVKKGEKIVQGAPVALEKEGTISLYKGTGIYLGIAITDSETPAYAAQNHVPVEVTVMVEGFAIVNWLAKAALEPGYVQVDGSTVNDYYPVAATSAEETNFIALTPADEANDVIQVLVK